MLVVILVSSLWSCTSQPLPCPQLSRSQGWSLPLYFFSFLPELFRLRLLMASELLEVEEECSTVDARSGSGTAGVKMTTLWCVLTGLERSHGDD